MLEVADVPSTARLAPCVPAGPERLLAHARELARLARGALPRAPPQRCAPVSSPPLARHPARDSTASGVAGRGLEPRPHPRCRFRRANTRRPGLGEPSGVTLLAALGWTLLAPGFARHPTASARTSPGEAEGGPSGVCVGTASPAGRQLRGDTPILARAAWTSAGMEDRCRPWHGQAQPSRPSRGERTRPGPPLGGSSSVPHPWTPVRSMGPVPVHTSTWGRVWFVRPVLRLQGKNMGASRRTPSVASVDPSCTTLHASGSPHARTPSGGPCGAGPELQTGPNCTQDTQTPPARAFAGVLGDLACVWNR